jgi:hypothetical protein
MNKNYALLLLILFSIPNIKSNKTSSKSLRKLEKIEVTYSKIENYVAIGTVLQFDIILEGNPNLGNIPYYLTITFRGQERSSTCHLISSSKLRCKYDCGEHYYNRIYLQSTQNCLPNDTISIKNLEYQSIQQTINLAFKNATIEYFNEYNPRYYMFKILIEDTTIPDNSYLSFDAKFKESNQAVDCTFSASIKTLICKYTSSYIFQKFLKEKDRGSIKWNNPEIIEDSVRVIIKQVKNIYANNAYFDNGKWTFSIYMNSNLDFPGYYFTLNVLRYEPLKYEPYKKTVALCKRETSVNSFCIIQEENQNPKDYLRVDYNQTGASIYFLNENKDTPSITHIKKKLKFVKVYELKFENNVWQFKIQVDIVPGETDILKDGEHLRTTIFLGLTIRYAWCTYSDSKKILLCERQEENQKITDELTSFICSDGMGSIIWINLDCKKYIQIKIPLETELTYVLSYSLKYAYIKWKFKLDVKPLNYIPGDSLIVIDILSDDNQYTVAECDKFLDSEDGITTFNCNCTSLDSTKSFKIINTKKSGSVIWKGLKAPSTIYTSENKTELLKNIQDNSQNNENNENNNSFMMKINYLLLFVLIANFIK